MITGTVDTTKFDAAFDSLANALQTDSTVLVEQEVKLLTKTIVNFVPPLRSKHGNPRASGEMAIQSENYNLITTAQPLLLDTIGSEKGVSNIQAWTTQPGGARLDIRWANLDAEGANLEALHRRYQNNRGKIKKEPNGWPGAWIARVATTEDARNAFVKKLKTRVGRGKAAMAQCAARLGVSFPSWISRHFGGSVSGIAIMDLGHLHDRNAPYVVFGSRAPGVNRLQSRVQAAVNMRARAMARRVKLVLSGYSQDIARGIRAEAKAHKLPAEHEESVE